MQRSRRLDGRRPSWLAGMTAKLVAVGVVVVTVAGTGTAYALGHGHHHKGRHGGRGAGIAVQAATAASGTATSQLALSGLVTSTATLALSPGVTGRVSAVEVRVGQVVRAGQVLVRLASPALQAQVAVARATVAAAEAKLTAAEAGPTPQAVAVARATVAAAEAKLTAAEAGPTPQAVAVARATVAAAEAKLTAAEAGPTPQAVAVARAEVAKAQVALQSAQQSYQQAQAAPPASTPASQAAQAVSEAQAGQAVSEAQAALTLAEAQAAAADAPPSPASLAPLRAAVAEARAQAAAADAPPSPASLAPLRAAVAEARAQAAAADAPPSPASLAPLRAAVAEARASEAGVSAQAAEEAVSAPFSGTVSSVTAAVGQQVSPASTLASLDGPGLSVQAPVSEQDLPLVHRGEAATISLPGGSASVPARVSTVSPAGNPSSLTFQVDLAPASEPSWLLPGEAATVAVVTSRTGGAVLVPASAVVSINGHPQIFTIGAGQTVSLVDVTPGISDGTTTAVRGIAPGTEVVTLGQTYLAPGDRARVTARVPVPAVMTGSSVGGLLTAPVVPAPASAKKGPGTGRAGGGATKGAAG